MKRRLFLQVSFMAYALVAMAQGLTEKTPPPKKKIPLPFKTIAFILAFFCSLSLHAQSLSKKIQKSWIKVSVENLSSASVVPDTLYTRYSFNSEKVDISFNPAWGQYSFNWSMADRLLTIGYEIYILEELTDTSLVFFKENFRRFRFVSEMAYSKRKRPDTTIRLNEQPVYVASSHLTPRYKREKALNTVITTELEKSYTVKHKNTLIARFVVTEKGKVERVQIVQGIVTKFDYDVIKLIQKTSGDWYPAKIDNRPVNCEMTFTIQYLDSIVPNMRELDGRMVL